MNLLSWPRLLAAVALSLTALSACPFPPNETCEHQGTCSVDARIDAPIACSPSMECDPGSTTPFCVDGTCVGCVDSAQCDGLFADREVCLKDPPGEMYGECVVCDEDDRQAPAVGMATDECTMVGMQVCDGGTHTCRPCEADAECTSGICSAGTCIAAGDIAYVRRAASGAAPCASTAPCPTLFLGESANKPFILVAPDATPYVEDTEIDFNMRQVTVRATGATLMFTGPMKFIEVRNPASVVTFEGGIYDGGNNAEPVFLNSGATLTLDGVTARNSTVDGVRSTGRLTVRRSTITGNDEMGINMNNSGQPFELTRSTVLLNGRTGVEVTAQSAVIVNNFILKNGAGVTVSALRISSLAMPGSSRVEFNTVAGNLSDGTTTGGGVSCGATSTVIENSIIYGNNGASEVSGCTVRFSTIEGATPDGPTGIINDAPNFIDTGSNNFGLIPGSPVAAKANPAADLTGPAATDYVGDSRPMPVGSRADLGADEIP